MKIGQVTGYDALNFWSRDELLVEYYDTELNQMIQTVVNENDIIVQSNDDLILTFLVK